MKKFIFDQAEFESGFPLEEVEIIISTPADSRHPTLARFADDVISEGVSRLLHTPTALSLLGTFEEDRRKLLEVAAIEVPDGCAWPCFRIEREWSHRHYVIDAGDAFISFRWLRDS